MPKKKFVQLCEKNNVSFTDEGNHLAIDPPDGFHFRGTGLHCFDIWNTHGQWKLSDAYDEMAEIMSMGLEACDSECEA